MPEIILPSTMVGLLTAFEPCFHAPTYRVFQLVLAGWMHCLGRRTITAVALASGGVGQRHISVFHRFFTRATWSLDAVGQVVFRLALAWIPADQPLFVVIDDTLARKTGKGIALATMHHDPLLSSARSRFAVSGTSGSCWRSGCRCRWAARAALRCPSCSGCTSAPGVVAHGTHPADPVGGHASGRLSRPTQPTRVRPSWRWPASCSPWWPAGLTDAPSTPWSIAPTPPVLSWKADHPTSTCSAACARTRLSGRDRAAADRVSAGAHAVGGTGCPPPRRWWRPADAGIRCPSPSTVGRSPTRLRLHRSLVWRPPRPAGPDRHRPRSQWPTPR